MTVGEIRGRAMYLIRTEIARLEGELAREQQEVDELYEAIFQLSETMAVDGPVAARLHEIEQYQNEVYWLMDRIRELNAKLEKDRIFLANMERRVAM